MTTYARLAANNGGPYLRLFNSILDCIVSERCMWDDTRTTCFIGERFECEFSEDKAPHAVELLASLLNAVGFGMLRCDIATSNAVTLEDIRLKVLFWHHKKSFTQ